MIKENNIVAQIASRMLIIDLLKCLFVSFVLYFSDQYFLSNPVISIAVAILGFIAMGVYQKVWKSKKEAAKNFMHLHNPNLEHSLSLLEKSNLNLAEQMQLDRISKTHINQKIELDKSFWVLLCLAFASFGFSFIPHIAKKNNIHLEKIGEASTSKYISVVPSFENATLKITPPTYMGMVSKVSTNLNAEVLAGSALEWMVSFKNDDNLKVVLENVKGSHLTFLKSNGIFVHKDIILHSGFYSIKAFQKDSLIYQSAFYRIEALPDNPPKVEPSSKNLYSFFKMGDSKIINISAKISDDFKVSQAYIVATVARGSGENVKFREVKWPVGGTNFQSANVSKTIDLKALNFSPGDELYYYWAAFDNKNPEPNFTKSDTYFVVFKDTASTDESEIATMAMNILPEYFRSQRQIIIDTEKLIKKRRKIKSEVFNQESNGIGYDQKILRLRYGQFLGEEFENNIGGPGHGHEDDGDFMKGFVHAHDTEEEGHDHQHADPAPKHDHGNENPNANQDPVAALLADYVHSHDDGETNTFYEQSTRSLLKMALEQMWQSELHLRLYEPEKALPFENKALVYLKEAQQKARVYVKKTGFDPPPIKEKEKRLTGEFTKFNAKQSITKMFYEDETRLLAASVLDILEKRQVNNLDKQKILRLGQILLELPNIGGTILKDIQDIMNSPKISDKQKENLKRSLMQILNFENIKNKGGKSSNNNKTLEVAFRKRLK